ncbi:hypothetical protein LUZ60_012781 [Juncus effusus]|nr:hypothetical protein LUZ60_012781 [Juncus effusus]
MMSSSLILAPPWPWPSSVSKTNGTHLRFSFCSGRFDQFGRDSSKRVKSRIKIRACWIEGNEVLKDGFGGWYGYNEPQVEERKGWNKYILVGFGASVMIVLAGLTYHSFQTKGFRYNLPDPFVSFYEKLTKQDKNTEMQKSEEEQISKSEQSEKDSVDLTESKENLFPGQWDRYKIAITVPTDAAQQNALSVLKKLQIIEDDATGDELCTRREFARWFVKLNSNLERNKKHKIIPDLLDSESVISAFNDIKIDDPDFWSIQLLGETGLVPSKLSSLSDSYFLPESYLSRFDLLNCKALIEHPFTKDIDKEILNKKATFLDLRACPNISLPLFIDLTSGEKSIFNRVFGNSRLIQPYKPVTKAQVAVALTSGRMENIIIEELFKIEEENKLKLAEMEEIKEEFIQKGDIERFWRAKLEKEREREIESKKAYENALLELERERKEREEGLSENMKEKLALEGERDILLSLKREIEELSEKVNSEKSEVMSEKVSVKKIYLDVYGKYENVIERKSRLESEKEALHVLRSWVEEEAKRIQSRANILEQALSRWRVNTNGD